MGLFLRPQQISRGTLDATFGKYCVSRAFGWHIICKKRVNTNKKIELSLPVSDGEIPKICNTYYMLT
jgi:hypothetical protein